MGSRWTTVAIIASGPSLTAEDCSLVEQAGIPAIAVNSSWKLARFCEVIYAGDVCWWDAYGKDIDIDAQLWSCTRQAVAKHKLNHHKAIGGYNSGMRALQFAIEQGADRIILLGFDCSLAHGLHWHGAHERTKNPDAGKVREWRRQFKQVSVKARMKGCEVINCSRHTELTCFEKRDLESVIESINRNVAVEGQQSVPA